MVASLYPEGGARRDAGFSIFYMGINIGAFLGSLLVPLLAAAFGWRLGFACRRSAWRSVLRSSCGRAATSVTPASHPAHERQGSWHAVMVFLAAGRGGAWCWPSRVSSELDARCWRRVRPGCTRCSAAAYFAYLLFFAGLTAVERKRVL